MSEQDKKRRNRRVLILALLLLLLALPIGTLVFGHARGGKHPAPAGGGTTGSAATTEPLSSEGGARLALLPTNPGAPHPGRKHWHAGADSGDGDFDFDDSGALQDLVLLTHGDKGPDDNAPQGDGGDGFSFGGGQGGGKNNGGAGGGGFGGGGGGEPSGFLPFNTPQPGGNDPGTDDPPGHGNDGPPGPRPGDPPFFSPTPPSLAAVPEPATWALFILGFGLTGFALRRARDAQRAPALTRTRPKRLG